MIILTNILTSNELGNGIRLKKFTYLALLLTILASFFAFSVIFFKLREKKHKYKNLEYWKLKCGIPQQNVQFKTILHYCKMIVLPQTKVKRFCLVNCNHYIVLENKWGELALLAENHLPWWKSHLCILHSLKEFLLVKWNSSGLFKHTDDLILLNDFQFSFL